MKLNFYSLILLFSHLITAQGPSNLIAYNNTISNYSLSKNNTEDIIKSNGFDFQLLDTGINSRFSEIGSGFFRNKLIMISSKKIGGLAKIDPNTNEAYKEIFCLDIDENGTLSSPYLFSRILNTNASEGQLTFSPNQKTVYYTRSTKENSLEYKIHRAELEEESHGNWINNEILSINNENVSIENPFVSHKGDKLYFSANYPDAIGGYDLYVCNIKPDGTLETPTNLGSSINTEYDDKYPSLSMDDKYLYFSSKGHTNIGGFDLFTSKITSNGFSSPRNMGYTINTVYDEVAYFLAAKNKGYVSSNRQNGKGGYDLYTATNDEIIQSLKGKIIDLETQIKLPNTVVILKDESGIEIDRTLSAQDATYSFNVAPFESYIISVKKDGFKDISINFLANNGSGETTYKKDFELNTTKPLIAKVEDEMRILLENIYFDFNKYHVKEESTISLNKVTQVLKENPKVKIAINAHTDNKGRATYNLSLSKKRAAAAAAYLIKNGISKNRIISNGYGETNPLIDCNDNCSEEELQTNRRIDFVILD